MVINMADYLTDKQEGFCLEFIKNGGNATGAYRLNYATTTMREETVWVSACKLLALPKVAQRIGALKAGAAAKAAVTIDSLNADLHRVMGGAEECGQYGAAVSAIMGKAKLNGLVEKKVVTREETQQANVSGFRVVSSFSEGSVPVPGGDPSNVEMRYAPEEGETLTVVSSRESH